MASSGQFLNALACNPYSEAIYPDWMKNNYLIKDPQQDYIIKPA